jgi:hypothetical protein
MSLWYIELGSGANIANVEACGPQRFKKYGGLNGKWGKK